MEPTSRAEGLQHAVRDMLVRLDSTITTQPSFDPTRSDRVFRIFVSDYSQLVLAPHLLALADADGCGARFDFLPQVADPQRSLECGEADLLVIPQALMSPDHPSEQLYREDFVNVVWRRGRLAQGPLTLDRYLAAGHVVMQPPGGAGESFEASFGFSAQPAMVVGTQLVATVHGRLTRLLEPALPISVHPSPMTIGPMEQGQQWHQYRTQDPGLAARPDGAGCGAHGPPPG